jgi:hypothetical protein
MSSAADKHDPTDTAEWKVDPDPFTIISLFLAIIGSVASVAAVVQQEKARHQSQVDRENDIKADLQGLTQQLEEEVRWLRALADSIEGFVHTTAVGTYSFANTRFGMTSITPMLYDNQLEEYVNLKKQLAERSLRTFDIENNILKALARYPLDLPEQAIRRSERFREHLRVVSSGGISYQRALTLLRQAANEGHEFVRDLRAALR